jgi:flagellar hook-associated protein 3 FlgL
MRISTNAWFQTQNHRMLALQSRADELNTDIATGKQLRDPARNPLLAQRAANFSRNLAENGQYARNIDTAVLQLETSASALGSASNIYARLQELAVSASSETLSVADRKTIGEEVGQLKQELLALANSRDASGQFVFAGRHASLAPFTDVPTGDITWRGDEMALVVPIGPDMVVQAGDTGAAVFERIETTEGRTSAFAILEKFASAMVPPLGPETVANRDLRRATMDTVIGGLQSASDRATDIQSGQGVRLARLEAERNRMAELDIDVRAALSAVEDTDISTAVIEMQRSLLILQAAQASFGQLSRLSLFDVLR